MTPAPVPTPRPNTSQGFKVTSVSVKKGNPTVIKYSWHYTDQSPEYFGVGVVNLNSGAYSLMEAWIETRGFGAAGTGTTTVRIDGLKHSPGKYVFEIVSNDDYNLVLAKSKVFHIKRSDFPA
ncbi:hypothetical protein FRB90_010133 [Tulasnella sp. 427]|nr:hypothetical protein FRB90_010133 [Tulasnella sp. 427]